MTRARLFKIIAGSCWVIAVAGLAADFNYLTHYQYNNPQAPDPKTGRIYPSSNRGHVFYVNAHEQFMLNLASGAMDFGVLGGVVAAYLAYGWKGRKGANPK